MSSHADLALGTVQFGVAYGVAGRREPIPRREASHIFARAWELGIRVIDTAPAYGDIEENIDQLARGYDFRMCSKVSALPDSSADHEVAAFVAASIRRSRTRLGERLNTILFHRPADLLGEHGETAWTTALDATANSNIRLGASCYSPGEVAAVRARFPIAVAQVPGNALDQRLTQATGLDGVELHLRSVFLQGLLLMNTSDASMRVPRAAAALLGWEEWRRERGLSRLQAALGIARRLKGVQYCVVGIDGCSQLEEIADAWHSAEDLVAPKLATVDPDVIDPRRW
jgi:aryl-alcohol dehydrogenase-like predicted oxidoreductase